MMTKTSFFGELSLFLNKADDLQYSTVQSCIFVLVCFHTLNKIVWFKVQGFFICHIINYTGYNQK